MLSSITRRIYRQGLDSLERGDLGALLARFDQRCSLRFIGDTSLGVAVSTGPEVRAWFERFGRLLPEPEFEIQHCFVAGPPWNQRLAAHVKIRSTVGNAPYENQFAHHLRLRWGKVVDDLIIEDSKRWDRACLELAELGIAEAVAPPIGTTDGP